MPVRVSATAVSPPDPCTLRSHGVRLPDDRPNVTVVIPTRDRWSVIHRALGSALSQEGVEVEVIVVDDASRRQPPERLRRLLGRAGADSPGATCGGLRSSQRWDLAGARRVDRIPRRRRSLGPYPVEETAPGGHAHPCGLRLLECRRRQRVLDPSRSKLHLNLRPFHRACFGKT